MKRDKFWLMGIQVEYLSCIQKNSEKYMILVKSQILGFQDPFALFKVY